MKKGYDYKKLKDIREKKGLTQKDMSGLLNTTQSNYSKLENGFKKIPSVDTIENLAHVLEMTTGKLTSILTGNGHVQHSGIKEEELAQVEEILKSNPLREDEFVFFATEVLDVEKYDFKRKYSGLNLKNLDEDDEFPIWDYPPTVNIMTSEILEIGFEFKKKKLEQISLWLANKKLGVIQGEHTTLVDELIKQLRISRVILIGNEDSIPGYFDTYMKAVFIATNAEGKSSAFKKGRFSSVKLLSKEEMEEMDNAWENNIGEPRSPKN